MRSGALLQAKHEQQQLLKVLPDCDDQTLGRLPELDRRVGERLRRRTAGKQHARDDQAGCGVRLHGSTVGAGDTARTRSRSSSTAA